MMKGIQIMGDVNSIVRILIKIFFICLGVFTLSLLYLRYVNSNILLNAFILTILFIFIFRIIVNS
ncbi:MAG: hypothetical protein LBN20_01925, partial [Endomicrobium sp.]|nr:hypothetical protein [Endomicrobium sp.]